MSRIFLNVPDRIEDIINGYEYEQFDCVYRAIRHSGDPIPKDFYPTFDDDEQKAEIEAAMSKGDMAFVIARQKELENNPSYYSVSLAISKDSLKDKFWRRKKTRYPSIVVGHTDPHKGKAHMEDDAHVSYFIFDYKDVDKNPYNDFKEDESVDE